MEKKVFIITAAGGNATAIQILEESKTRSEYAALGRSLINDYQSQAVEQAGFLIPSQNHFEMSGGEFCGNAARAATILLARETNRSAVTFTMSGFSGLVQGKVRELVGDKSFVECFFPSLPLKVTKLSWDKPAFLVDLGGIVHVVIEDDFPQEFTSEHRRICQLLNLEEREAVGVVWTKKNNEEAKIDPVVWVKEVNSFFYESSCGSGSIAVAKALGVRRIKQPTGQIIEVEINQDGVILKSEMEVKDDWQ